MSPLIESIVKASPEQLAQISQDLVRAGEMIEKRTSKTSPEWFAVTRDPCRRADRWPAYRPGVSPWGMPCVSAAF